MHGGLSRLVKPDSGEVITYQGGSHIAERGGERAMSCDRQGISVGGSPPSPGLVLFDFYRPMYDSYTT